MTIELTACRWESRPDVDGDELRRLIRVQRKYDEVLKKQRDEFERAVPQLHAALGSRESLEEGFIGTLMRSMEDQLEHTATCFNLQVEEEVTRVLASPPLRAHLQLRGRMVRFTVEGDGPLDERETNLADAVSAFFRGATCDQREYFATVEAARAAFATAITRVDRRQWLARNLETTTVATKPLEGTFSSLVFDVPWSADAAHVQADLLLENADVRGELAARTFAGEIAELLVDDNRDLLLGALADTWGRLLRAQWRHGFVVGAALSGRHERAPLTRVDLAETTSQLIRLPMFQSIEQLSLGLPAQDDAGEWPSALRHLASAPIARRLRRLRFDNQGCKDYQLSWLMVGDLAVEWDSFQQLEELFVHGSGARWGQLRLPNLRRFVRETGGLSRSELLAFASARWPGLTHFEVWTGAREYGADVRLDDVEVLLHAASDWPLEEFGVMNSELTAAMLPLLARLPWLGRLKRLRLAKGTLTDEDVPVLERLAPQLSTVATLDVSENQLSGDAVARLRRVLPNLEASSQRASDGGGRYVAVGE